ncbi:hypothetical protein BJ165DRAFT_895817 [Panaeolus papilionaceus]|nr:hypothetical protein BJ165DRAFT_895817 [Panaeolus papilionaceus]
MSFFARLLSHIRTPIRYVGRDLEGNTFFEMRNWNDPGRTKRSVQYRIPEESWRYIGGGKRLPVQWTAWLTHTRQNPPTVEELEADQTRMQRLQVNVAAIEARDRAEAEERRRMRQADAKQAIEDAAERVVQQSFVDQPRVDLTQEAQPTSASASANLTHSPEPVNPASKVKIRPPSFLTPATPRNQRKVGSTTASFVPPKLGDETKESPGGQEESPTPVSPWKSKPFSETESWTPQAKRRG